jgi:hypothetical protein
MKSLGFRSTPIFHVGAGNFEELEHYLVQGFSPVHWFDPIRHPLADMLPPDNFFHHVALGAGDTESAQFYIFEHSNYSSFLRLKNNNRVVNSDMKIKETITTQVKSLSWYQDRFLDEFAEITLVLDVQGYEHQVLLGTNLHKISQIVIETSKFPMYEDESSHALIHNFLISAGFYENLDLSSPTSGHGDHFYSRNEGEHPYLRIKEISKSRFFKALIVFRRRVSRKISAFVQFEN